MRVPTWILEKGSGAIRRRWRQFREGLWEPSEWVEATPLLIRPFGPSEGAHLYRFGNAMPADWEGSEVLPVLLRIWKEYPCFFLPRTQMDAWLIGNRQNAEVTALIQEIVEWPEGRLYRGTAGERLAAVPR